ncbi:glycosyltransferase [Mucilaginibacter sp.]|uniref:glycosyltransferase n=1 Tax=Mucilaginibacter sp. TaxID=1882438 RepID=UPI003D14DE16
MDVSVIIPTYNPNIERLNQTLNGLKQQTLAIDAWELIIIDNNSSFNIAEKIDLSWHANSRIIAEPKQGLTYARLKGFLAAKANIIILVDDDNILDQHYLQNTLEVFKNNPMAGAIGGKSIPLFEQEQPEWLKEFYGNLALRDLGENIILNTWDNTYPASSPIGAGIAIRKAALENYIAKVSSNTKLITDRSGSSLSSGGDNDIVLEVLKAGWQVGYFPSLSLLHIIPKQRTQVEYLSRLINNTNRSWIQLLEYHQINPWKKIPLWTVPLRKAKAWLTYKAWKGDANHIRWSGACGTFDGLSDINGPLQ